MLNREKLYRLDWMLIISALLLTGIGLLTLFAINLKAIDLPEAFNPINQVIFAIIGIGAMFFISGIDYSFWYRMAVWVFIAGLVSLALVLAVGSATHGSTRWIDLGFMQFQPSEIMKLGAIMYLAKVLSKQVKKKSLQILFVSGLILALPVGLIVLQPDLGTGLVLIFIWLVMIYMAGVNRKLLLVLGLIAAVSVPVLSSNLQPYQQKRLESFLNPLSDPRGSGYNVVQSQITIGSGQFRGRGLSAGSQSQLNFLPSQHTDFIFAVVGEKMGFLGNALVIFLYFLILVKGILIAWRASDNFAFLMAGGIVALFAFHIIINIGMNEGIMPVTGLPLPFISYGGTNLIVSMVAIGMLESIKVHKQELEFSTSR